MQVNACYICTRYESYKVPKINLIFKRNKNQNHHKELITVFRRISKYILVYFFDVQSKTRI